MNKIIPLLSVFCLLYSCTGSDKSYILSITEQHKQYAASFTDTTQSPLDSAEQITFKGVAHFIPDKNYKVTAKVLWLPYTGIVELPHSRGDFRPYFQAAHSHRYSCPIVPKENALDIAIRAGERNID